MQDLQTLLLPAFFGLLFATIVVVAGLNFFGGRARR